MPNDPNPKDPRNLWQNQEAESVTITLDYVRRRSARLERRIYTGGTRANMGPESSSSAFS